MVTPGKLTRWKVGQVTEAAPLDFRSFDRVPCFDPGLVAERVNAAIPVLTLRLGRYLRCPVELGLLTITEKDQENSCLGPESAGHSISIRFPGQNACGVLSLGNELVPIFVDLILGGSGAHGEPIQRRLTELERSLLHAAFEIICDELSILWNGRPFRLAETRELWTETDPQTRQLLSRQVEIPFAVKCREHPGRLSLILPSTILFPPQKTLADHDGVDPGEVRERVLERLNEAPVCLEASIEGLTATLATLAALQPGDVLAFDCPSSASIQLLINGSGQFEGRLAEKNGGRVLAVERKCRRC